MHETSSLSVMIRSYRLGAAKTLDQRLGYYKGLPNLTKVIRCAALALDPSGKRNPHQRRLKKQVLNTVKERLMQKEEELARAKDFEGIKRIVEHCAVSGFGPLAIYDTSLRIGAWLNLLPRLVYLHAGTTDGARAMGLDASRDFLQVQDLPKPLKEMEPHHIENFLCIYKAAFKAPSVSNYSTLADCLPKQLIRQC